MRRPRAPRVAVAAVLASLSTSCGEDDVTPPPLPQGSPTQGATATTAGPVSPSVSWLPLSEQVQAARRSKGIEPRVPSKAERSKYERWVGEVASAAWGDTLPSRSAPKGFVARLAEGGHLWLLAEDTREKRGAGLVVVRPSIGQKVLIEAPHTYFEQGTLDLALLAFEVLEARALLVNTIHRGGAGEGDARKKLALSGKSPADPAHNATGYYATAHRTLIKLDPDLLTIQFHGFANARASDVDMVLSASKSQTDVSAVARSLGAVLGSDRVRTYPEDIDILGGVTNVEARASRKSSSRFLHIEMSKSLRDKIKADADFAREVVEALGEGIRESRP